MTQNNDHLLTDEQALGVFLGHANALEDSNNVCVDSCEHSARVVPGTEHSRVLADLRRFAHQGRVSVDMLNSRAAKLV